MVRRIHYCLGLNADPSPAKFIAWRKSYLNPRGDPLQIRKALRGSGDAKAFCLIHQIAQSGQHAQTNGSGLAQRRTSDIEQALYSVEELSRSGGKATTASAMAAWPASPADMGYLLIDKHSGDVKKPEPLSGDESGALTARPPPSSAKESAALRRPS